MMAVLAPRVEEVVTDGTALREAAYAMSMELDTATASARRRDLRDRVEGLLMAVRELARPA